MKCLKLKKAQFNNRRKVIELKINEHSYSLPYVKFMGEKIQNISEIFIDPEMESLGVTLVCHDGSIESIPVDAFLDYNKDFNYIREIQLHELTVKALELMRETKISKKELTRRMNTSMSQILRLLDPANYNKSYDQMVKLIYMLGSELEINVA